jgi:hypothetical protein
MAGFGVNLNGLALTSLIVLCKGWYYGIGLLPTKSGGENMKGANWLIAATLVSMMIFVEADKANALGNASLSGTYRGLATGSFWNPNGKFDFVYATTFTFDGSGKAVESANYTQQGTFEPLQIGPCNDSAACTYGLNSDGTGKITCTDTASNCGDTGGTFKADLTTDGNHIYFIISGYPAFQAFAISGTLNKDTAE